MMTKTAFFALLNDKENKIGVTAHVAVYKDSNGNTSLIISQTGAPNAGLSNHKSDAALQAAFTKYNAWLNEWFTAHTEAAHTEALATDALQCKVPSLPSPLLLPKDQKIDVLRAAAKMVPGTTQDMIERVAIMSVEQMDTALTGMIKKGWRVTAHLTRTKRFGYGFLTFGLDGQLPPGGYHAMTVTDMRHARKLASQYYALMWNF